MNTAKFAGKLLILGVCASIFGISDSANAQVQTVPVTNCREAKRSDLIIRDEPGGQEIGRLREGENIYIANEGRNGWVPIERPGSGYVEAKDLSTCGEADIVSEAVEREGLSTPSVNDCRETNVSSVTLRDQPQGEVIGTLDRGEKVYIQDNSENGWVEVQYPVSGYVTSANLSYCNTIGQTFPTSSCREVNVGTRLNVRSQPDGEIIGSLENKQEISIRNRGENGWVPVFAPVEGYVSANYLEYCP